MCDDNNQNFITGWYRFQGAAGTRMPTKCVPRHRWGAISPGWLNGKHPTVAEGEVSRRVCFHRPIANKCCGIIRHGIKVKNCSSYYVYKLIGTNACGQRYCGTGDT